MPCRATEGGPFACAAADEGPALPEAGVRPGVGPLDIIPFAITTPCGGDAGFGVVALGKADELDPAGDMLREGRLPLAWVEGARLLFRTGVSRFVDRLMISFPCTTKLSVDFLRSLVSISVNRYG